jgi:hypothetical protein
MRKSLFVAALLSLSVTGGALAFEQQQRGGTPEEQKACSPDVQRHCRAVMNDSDLAILGCLQQFRDKLHKACDMVLTNNGFPNPNAKN